MGPHASAKFVSRVAVGVGDIYVVQVHLDHFGSGSKGVALPSSSCCMVGGIDVRGFSVEPGLLSHDATRTT
jgi:hypothetical protein